MNWVAKILFPYHSGEPRRKEMRTLMVGMVLASFVAAFVGILMFYVNKRHS